MKLNVNFSGLAIAASQMRGLQPLLDECRAQKLPYQEGLKWVTQFVRQNGGSVSVIDEEGKQITRVKLGEIEADCFQPFEDIDLFYFES